MPIKKIKTPACYECSKPDMKIAVFLKEANQDIKIEQFSSKRRKQTTNLIKERKLRLLGMIMMLLHKF
jgi:hypothetical protein